VFLALDGTFWVQLLNFVIFFALLNVVFLRPVSAAIRKRRGYINSVTRDYDAYREQIVALQAQAESTRAAARREAELILSRARAQASNETAQLSSEQSDRVMQTVEEAHQTASRELQSARAGEPHMVEDLAMLMLERAVPEMKR